MHVINLKFVYDRISYQFCVDPGDKAMGTF